MKHDFNGYKQHPTPLNNADCLWQKRVRNEQGETKYFINIYEYDFRKYGMEGLDIKYGVEVCIFPEGIDTQVNLSFNLTTIEEAEKFIEDFYIKNNCAPDLHNN